jgi:hypothetical protein
VGVLTDAAKDPVRRRRIVEDGERLIEQEVADKSGLTGLAVRAGYKVVKGVRPGMIPMALDHLLDDFCAQLDPFHERFRASGEKDIRAFFVRNGTAIAQALLSITDARARGADHRLMKSAYERLRPEAVRHVTAAMPRVADLVRRHAPTGA